MGLDQRNRGGRRLPWGMSWRTHGRGGLSVAALLAVLAVLASCSAVGYYAQAVRGGLDLLCRKRPISRLLADPAVEPGLKAELRQVLAMRDFAVTALALPDNRSYRSYADLERPYATWTVVAAPELAVEPLAWCFPIAGCVTYRGYFSRAGAEAFAAGLAAQGHDVSVGGVAALSTLGWLADPVLNTFIAWPEADLAGLLFHELAHQVAYAADDTTFNESFASAVEAEGVRRWLTQRGRPDELEAWRRDRRRDQAVLGLLLAARQELAAVYSQPRPAGWKRQRKGEVLAALAADYRALAAPWGGSRWDAFFAAELNNASLSSVGAYSELVPAFEALLARCGGDLPRFYAEVQKLIPQPPERRREALAQEGGGED